ncbi:maleylpyruvate isomerase family mycothiol-dependent enzyme [Pseudonocardia sp. S2-4]|uniref:Maleylpyruvate isomerase family mycothiol-dependent enzyme n=2 Tax=Pseudonocardia humida TaxID=2800819 RepID=A0ABT1A931_9PSEU|nr:maleylpyruvate isomerase family mycothiol-dependent enzyme [Pseudonocardia humida]
MGAGTEFLGHAVDALHDDALREPSTLPGWTRAHVVAHVARNAEALTRLATWARTGVETPMYPDRAARAAEIEASAQAPAETLRRELTSTARDLDAALAALDATTWQSTVRSALGRPLPATEVPWMRIREVWLHAVDLDAGAGLSDLPPEVVDALLDDASATLSTRDGCPSAVLAPDDREQRWQLGEPGGSVTVSGPAAAVMGWLIGRTDGADLTTTGGPLPTPPPWL